QRQIIALRPGIVVKTKVHEAGREIKACKNGVVTARRATALERVAKPLVVIDPDILDVEAAGAEDLGPARDRLTKGLLLVCGRFAVRKPHAEGAEYSINRIITQFGGRAVPHGLGA